MKNKYVVPGLIIAVLIIGFYVVNNTLMKETGLEEPKKITVITANAVEGDLGYYAIINKKISIPKGIDIDIKQVSVGKINDMIFGGVGDFGTPSTSGFAIGLEKGVKLKAVGVWLILGKDEKGLSRVYAREGSGVNGPRDLIGKKVGVPPLTTTTASIFLGIMKNKYGIDPSQMELIPKPFSTLPLLLERGDVDAVMVGSSQINAVESIPGTYLVADIGKDFKEEYGEYPTAALLTVRTDLLEKDKETVKEVVDTIKKSYEWGVNNSDEVFDAFVKRTGTGNKTTYQEFLIDQSTMMVPLTEERKNTIKKIWMFSKELGTIENIPGDDVFENLVEEG